MLDSSRAFGSWGGGGGAPWLPTAVLGFSRVRLDYLGLHGQGLQGLMAALCQLEEFAACDVLAGAPGPS
jgi:hypothetical protein